MAFEIPHAVDAVFPDQGQWDSADLDVLLQGIGGNVGVVYGCQVVQKTGLTVTVQVGNVMLSNGIITPIAQGDVTHDPADPTNPRLDLVVIDSAGAKQIRKGIAAALNAKFPVLIGGDICLAAVHIPAGDTTITTSQIIDKRMLIYPQVWVEKTANQTVTNSTTLVNDNHLKLPLGPNEQWFIELMLYFDGAYQADMKMAWTMPAGCTFDWGAFRGSPSSLIGAGQGKADFNWDLTGTATLVFGTAISSTFNVEWESTTAKIYGLVLNGANAGDLQLQWAQNTANATPTTVRHESYIRARKLA